MSGGSHDYVCYKIENELVGCMKDDELNDLMKDIAGLAHDLEWADSCDISDEDYFETVKKFKEKWFKQERNERLKTYIDEKIDKTKTEIYRLLGENH